MSVCSSEYGRRSLGDSNGVRSLIWLKASGEAAAGPAAAAQHPAQSGRPPVRHYAGLEGAIKPAIACGKRMPPIRVSTTGLSGRHPARPILAVSRRFGHPLQGADDAGKQATATVT